MRWSARFAWAALALLWPGPVLAAAPAASVAASPDEVRAHVEFLASDLTEGRASGTRGHEIAAAYAASRFRALGFEPAGEAGSYYQWVPLREARTVPGSTRLRLIDGGREQPLSDKEASLAASLSAAHRDFSAPLVFVGHGLDDPQLGLDDYRGLDVRGAIVVALRGAPGQLSSDIKAHLGESRKAMAARHGAVGLILLPERAGGDSREALRAATRAVNGWIDAEAADPARIVADIGVTEEIAARLFEGAPRNLKQVRSDIARGAVPRGFALRGRMAVRGDSQWRDFKSQAVIARLRGRDDGAPDEHVVMMGHLDHLGIKADAAPGEDAIYNGALDNAAGVATLLEAARRFATAPARPRRSILFLLHTGEELGLLGSQYFARHPTVPIDRIVAGVDLDMPVPLYPFTDVVAFGADHSTVAEVIEDAARGMGLAVSPDPMPQEGIFTRSDHYSLVEKGVPAVLLFTGYANGGKAEFDRFFSTRYHKVSDDLTLPIQWDSLARYAELNYRIALTLADAAQPPRWYAGDYFGNLFAPAAPRAAPRRR